MRQVRYHRQSRWYLTKDADLVITGEGRMDSQSIHGKTPIGVAAVAKRYGKPLIGIVGSLSYDVDVVHEYGIDAVFSVLSQVGTLEETLRTPQQIFVLFHAILPPY